MLTLAPLLRLFAHFLCHNDKPSIGGVVAASGQCYQLVAVFCGDSCIVDSGALTCSMYACCAVRYSTDNPMLCNLNKLLGSSLAAEIKGSKGLCGSTADTAGNTGDHTALEGFFSYCCPVRLKAGVPLIQIAVRVFKREREYLFRRYSLPTIFSFHPPKIMYSKGGNISQFLFRFHSDVN